MLDRKQYDLELDKVRKEQVDNIAEYIKDFFKLNYKFSEKELNSEIPEDVLKKIEAMEMPRVGRDAKEVGDELVNDILKYSMTLQHPRYFSFVTSAVSPYSLAGAVLTDIYNPNASGWDIAPASAMIEEKLIKWMGSLAGWDKEKCGGLFTSGGSLSNLTGCIAARENKLPGRYDLPKGIAYVSDQTHSSARKGLKMMGLRDDQIKVIETDDDFKIRLDLLEDSIKEEIKKGNIPFLIVGSIGSTNTGSIDPLPELVVIKKKYNMWLHIDGAYGGSILFSDIYRNLAKGIEEADSLSWDTHKWSMQTYSCSCVIARDKQTLITAFNEHPEYLEDVRSKDHNDGWDLGIEMSRPARHLKLWYTIQAMGTDLLSDVIDYAFYNSKIAAQNIVKVEGWEIISKPSCGAFNVRYAPKEIDPSKYDEINALISKRIIESGYAYIVNTTLKGKKVLRISVINANTTTEDVLNTVEYLQNIGKDILKEYLNK